jgi:hypothetical protein
MRRHGVTIRERASTYAPFIDRKESHGDQGQELEEEHGEEESAKDAEGKASGEEGQEVATGVNRRTRV